MRENERKMQREEFGVEGLLASRGDKTGHVVLQATAAVKARPKHVLRD